MTCGACLHLRDTIRFKVGWSWVTIDGTDHAVPVKSEKAYCGVPLPGTREEAKLKLALSLQTAWASYEVFFGQPPHGTLKQIRALLELMPDKSVFGTDASDITKRARQHGERTP